MVSSLVLPCLYMCIIIIIESLLGSFSLWVLGVNAIGIFYHPTLRDPTSMLRKNTLPRVRFEPEALDYRTSRLPQTDGLTTKLPIKITEFNFKDVNFKKHVI
uniref:Uncharacterized protein n=1 Tax=Cacopsylla melanoneura TaxID=428564 RepID=A0A8D8W2T3_9HEMI